MSLEQQLQALLPRVQKPARYLGNEWNVIQKDHSLAEARLALAFPDLYEVGMSNLGLKILYEVVNRRPEMLMERVFAPAEDMEALMRSHSLPLFALESKRPVRDFDFFGFSVQYELSYTNIINMLDLAQIPLYSSQREETHPLIVGGGPCIFNPEPLAPFFDLFLLGDGEEALPELLLRWAELKKEGKQRWEILKSLAGMPGVYVPSLYVPKYIEDRLVQVGQLEAEAPATVEKRIVKDLDTAPYPVSPIVPHVQAVHDRAVVELFRGCSRGCRFCQAGVIYRPVRRRSPEALRRITREILTATGYEEVSLASLSSSDYPDIDTLVGDLAGDLPCGHVKFSLPSLRVDSFSVKLADQVQQGKRGSLTFAPEAGTERLRKVIGKRVSEEDIFSAASDAFKAGWQTFKFYFMIGLPTETEEDVKGIADLCDRVVKHIKREFGRKPRISISASTFVPKAHTSFQWEPQLPIELIKHRQRLLGESLKSIRSVDFSWHDAGASFLEAVFARGDRFLAPLLEKAWQKGCLFDGWSERFSFKKWMEAFEELGIDPANYAYRKFSLDETLPWDHLSSGVAKKNLAREYDRALNDRNNSPEEDGHDPYAL